MREVRYDLNCYAEGTPSHMAGTGTVTDTGALTGTVTDPGCEIPALAVRQLGGASIASVQTERMNRGTAVRSGP